MKLNCWLFLIGFLLANFLSAEAQFLVKAGGLNQDEVLDIASDAAGNSYITGYFGSSLSFPNSISVSSSGLSDIFLVKTDASGQVLWAVKAGGSADERGNAVCVDAVGNVYITGYFQGTATFGATSLTSAGAQDIFVAKYTSAGLLAWVRRAGGSNADISNGIAVDASGNVFISGEIKGNVDFGAVNLTAQGSDAFVCKYDPSGTVLWAKNGAGPDNSRGLDLAVDAAGNVYGIGQFSNDITFDVAQANNILNAVYLVKFDASGAEQWFRKIGGAASNIAYSIDVDASSNVYLTGDFTGNLVFFPNTGSPLTNPYANRIFIAKYNSSGSLQWSKAAGSSNELSSKKIAVGGGGQVYIGGFYKCTLSEYATVYGESTFNSVGFKDGFVAQYDQNGGFVWARNIGGNQDDYVTGVAPSLSNMPYVSAVFVDNIFVPYDASAGYQYNGLNIKDTTVSTAASYCSDTHYNQFLFSETTGGSDLIYGNLINPNRAPYDYYLRLGAGCSLDMEDVCVTDYSALCPDSIILCGPGNIHAFSYTHDAGPLFNYQWSTGGTDSVLNVSASGTYSVTITTKDGCYTSNDDVYVNIQPQPQLPLLSDNVGINNQVTFAQPVKVCYPDSVILTGSTTGAVDYYWSNHPGQTSATTSVSGVGNYYLTYTTVNANGCETSNAIQVQILPELPPIDPSIYFFADLDLDDSLQICGPGSLQLGIMNDSTNLIINCNLYNLSGDVTINQQPVGNYTFCNNVGLALYAFSVDSTDWYHIKIHLRHSNLCDTVYYDIEDSIYVEVFPLPQGNLDLSGPQYLCPGDTILLTATADVPFVWQGDYAFLVNPNVAAVTDAGFVKILALLTDPVTGCQNAIQDTITISYVLPPNIISNPASGIICPNDSLLLSVTNSQFYDSIQWIGPQGAIGGNDTSIYVTETGLYYCIATSASGCAQQSNSIEVYQYGTPYLSAEPGTRLCPAPDSITISLIAPAGSSVQWNPPLSGTDTVQVITEPGVYSVQVNSCGTTTVTDIEITESTLFAEITTTQGLTFCEGDSVVLELSAIGASHYEWSPTGDTAVTHIVAYTSGAYVVTVTDTAGCEYKSAPVTVTATPDNIPAPEVTDTSFCPPDALVLTASGQGQIYWYDQSSSLLLDSGYTYTTVTLDKEATYFLQAAYGGCLSNFTPLNINIALCDNLVVPNIFTPNGDGTNDYVDFSIEGTTCFYVEIRNRWGVKVFDSEDPSIKWYGTIFSSNKHVVDGVYFYIIDYCPHTGGHKIDKGTITVIRN